MAVYNLERLSVLLVEDNAYIRDIFESLLRELGIRHVSTARNGKDAVEFLELVGANPTRAGVMGIDLIISDLVMSPINGLLLLQWLRTSKRSPGRFTPFIMLSGAADREYVQSARDLGVNEFLAKPFSVKSVSERLMQVIDHPRQFVVTRNYFGPDRRRHRQGPPADGERRHNSDESVSIVYSADKVVKPEAPTDVWYFRLPNSLKDKVGGAGATGPGELPTELLEKAEEQLEKDSLDFADWAINYINQLAEALEEAKAEEVPDHREAAFERLNLLAHELRGQGGTFGYPLITLFAKSLYGYTQPGFPRDDSALELVKAHVDIMRAVIRDRVSGDGGKLGRELFQSLQAAIKKHTGKDGKVG